MLFPTLLLAAQLLPPQAPAPADTTRLIRGFLNQQFAWGTVLLQDGQRLQGYLPAEATGVDGTLAYYASPPDTRPTPKLRFLAVRKVRWLRVRGQYLEQLQPNKRTGAYLAARRQTGAVELFVVQQRVPALVTTFLGPTPAAGLPAMGAADGVITNWYLRRAMGEPQLISAGTFATQVAAFLADDRELAAKVAAGATGYQFDNLESIVRQYNQHAQR